MGGNAMTQLTRRSALAGAAAITAAAAIGPLTATKSARAATPLSGKQAPGFYRYKVGDYEITAIHDGVWLPDITPTLVRNVSVPEIQKTLSDQFQRTDKMVVPFTPIMVNTGSKLVLIDTGTAGRFVPTATSFMDNFAAAGFDPKQVDTVVISHFHGDHINGIRTKENELTFPNAEILVPAVEWTLWMDDSKATTVPENQRGNFGNSKRVFGSIANKVTPFEPGKEVAPGITSIAAPGHTPGHTAFAIASGNQSMLHTVDTTNIPSLFARNPDWQFAFDTDGDLAVQTRKRLYDRAAADKMLTAGYHWPFPAVGYVSKEGNGYRVNPLTWSGSL
jgi:glyoxylase-like metal-dependent hydrolase (beta-lactamase superfamily II)